MSPSTESRAQRGRRNLRQFLTFGLVGGSGIVVNLAVTIVLKWLVPHYQQVALDLPFTRFNLRWYHVIVIVAFVVANTWNYQLNRHFTFKARGRTGWWRGLVNFMGIGGAALLVGLVIQTLLLKENSTFYLGRIEWLDDSNGLRTKLYWATLIQIALTMPINFLMNKLWTFRAVRSGHPEEAPITAPVVAPEYSPQLVERQKADEARVD